MVTNENYLKIIKYYIKLIIAKNKNVVYYVYNKSLRSIYQEVIYDLFLDFMCFHWWSNLYH